MLMKLRRSDDTVTSLKIAAALKDSHGIWKHPSYDDTIVILAYEYDSDASFDVMHARDALNENNEDSEEDDDEGGTYAALVDEE